MFSVIVSYTMYVLFNKWLCTHRTRQYHGICYDQCCSTKLRLPTMVSRCACTDWHILVNFSLVLICQTQIIRPFSVPPALRAHTHTHTSRPIDGANTDCEGLHSPLAPHLYCFHNPKLGHFQTKQLLRRAWQQKKNTRC